MSDRELADQMNKQHDEVMSDKSLNKEPVITDSTKAAEKPDFSKICGVKLEYFHEEFESLRPERSKYHREIKPGVWVDVYDVLKAFDPQNRNAADDHAIKKMLVPGNRGVKGGIQDRKEAIQSLERSIQIESNSDDESRMDIIGQNGNDGLHYGQE